MQIDRRRLIAAGSGMAGAALLSAPHLKAEDFGAKGDGATDDHGAIQRALDEAGRAGGGTVLLAQPPVHYRIARGLVLPSHVCLAGAAPVRYPFSAGGERACALVADFTDPQQWVIEAATTHRGRRFAPNAIVEGGLPDGTTYNCSIQNLLITSTGKVPLGGIRLHGCPGSSLDGVAVHRVGCGVLLNFVSGGRYQVHTRTLYFGVIAWEEVNACSLEIYATQSEPFPDQVPSEYRFPPLAGMAGHFRDTLHLANEGHASNPVGLVCGASQSTSTGNRIDATVEQFGIGLFLYQAYAANFGTCYLEAAKGRMQTAVAASRSRFTIEGFHAYMSGDGNLFDLGLDLFARINATGIIFPSRFGKAPLDDGNSLVSIDGLDAAALGAPIQPGLRYRSRRNDWSDVELLGGWRHADGYRKPAAKFDTWTQRVHLRGALQGGGDDVLFVLPKACRPSASLLIGTAGTELSVNADGTVRYERASARIGLDGISFDKW